MTLSVANIKQRIDTYWMHLEYWEKWAYVPECHDKSDMVWPGTEE